MELSGWACSLIWRETCLALKAALMLGEDKFSDGTSSYDQRDANKMISINSDGSDPTVVNNFKTEGIPENV